MQRSIGSEFRVALAAIVFLTIPVIFALLLINNEDRDGTATPPTQVAQSTAQISVFTSTPEEMVEETSEATEAVTVTPEPTEEPASDTPTSSETVTVTATVESSLSVLQVRTPVSSATENPTETDTVTPSATPSATATMTASTTASATNTQTATTTPSDTPSATNTNTPTSTATPSRTSTLRPTSTDRPTRTPSDTPTATSTLRPSATPVEFDGILATPTLPASPTAAAVSAATRTPSSCRLPRGWTTYRVQPGDTLFAISLATDSTVDELRYANCIDDVDNITSEDVIFVPRAPLRPVSTFVPAPVDSRPDLAVYGCNDPRVQITSPRIAAQLQGSFTVTGTAMRDDFGYYKIEIRPDWAEIYNFYLDSYTPVQNGILGVVNSEIFGSGLHWVRLTVVDAQAGIPAGATCEVPVIFE